MTTFTESTVEDATLAWLGQLGYAVRHGPDIAAGERVIVAVLAATGAIG